MAAGTQVRYRIGDADERQWGSYQVVDTGDGYIVKRITVRAGARLSLQYHDHRDERWVCVAGTGLINLDGDEFAFNIGDIVRVDRGSRHRIANTGSEPLVFIEVQLGVLLDEEDIVRLEDDYGRL